MNGKELIRLEDIQNKIYTIRCAGNWTDQKDKRFRVAKRFCLYTVLKQLAGDCGLIYTIKTGVFVCFCSNVFIVIISSAFVEKWPF
jgi:hypothetical protein